jgi:hypothetical protein
MSFQGYDPELNRPPSPDERDRTLEGRIVFAGSWEAERARTVEALADAQLPVTVLSSSVRWQRSAEGRASLEWRRWEVYGRAYSVALGSAAIALGVLRKAAGDLHTQRTFEIPACGVAMLAERTDEHLALFREGTEAEFFSSDAECVVKARRLLDDVTTRTAVAEAGRRRCLESGYSWADRLSKILRQVGEVPAGREP